MTIILPDGTERPGRGRIATVTRADGPPQVTCSMFGIDARDLLGVDGLTIRLEDGREAPIHVTSSEEYAETARWEADGPLHKP
jgi:hypothetical protein